MIKNFKCKETEKLFEGKFIKKLPTDVHRVALRKLKMLDAATMVETLKVPSGNKLEVLVTVEENIVSESMINGVFVLLGMQVMHLKLKLLTIIEVSYA